MQRLRRLAAIKLAAKFEQDADPKVQLTQAINEAQDQHLKLKAQVANVVASQKQTEIRLNRAMGELEKTANSARKALMLADQAQSDGDTHAAGEYTRLAESLANRMIGLESVVDSLKELHLETTTATEQARTALDQSAFALQRRLTERQKLLSQLDQTEVQEQLNAAMAQFSDKTGTDSPSLDQVRTTIEERYARAMGTAEAMAATHIELQTFELERLHINAESEERLKRIRRELPAPSPGKDDKPPSSGSAEHN